MSKCVGCYKHEALVQRLCAMCFSNFTVHVARPDELVETHILLHLACKAVEDEKLPMHANDYRKLMIMLGTVCWVMGCPAGVPIKDLIIVIAKKMQELHGQVTNVETPTTSTIQ